jgi:hypothetical protein
MKRLVLRSATYALCLRRVRAIDFRRDCHVLHGMADECKLFLHVQGHIYCTLLSAAWMSINPWYGHNQPTWYSR